MYQHILAYCKMVLLKSLCILLAIITINYITAQESGGPKSGGSGGYGGPGGPGGIGGSGGSGGNGGAGGSSSGSEDDERLRQIGRCNYTEVPGRTCASCNQTLVCSPINIGVVRTCRRRSPYCNEGRCSRTPADGCDATSD